ncbi:MAG: sialidase family protein [Acidobacteriota bacterium]
MKTRIAISLWIAASVGCAAKLDTPAVTTLRVPGGGIQPQIVERDGIVHMLYFSGDAAQGILFYVKSSDYGQSFSKPIQVNTPASAAIAVGNIRGAQLAIGSKGRVHVAWNGTAPTTALPMYYTRLNDAGNAFEPARNVIHAAYGLDGGGSLAADANGNVYVFWHAPAPGQKGEQNRRVWVAKSSDGGKDFEPERLAFDKPVGACGCCGLKAYADAAGNVYVLFRSADQIVNRDIWLLSSTDQGRTFTGANVSHWNIGACVMSSEAFASAPNGILAAWETEKQTWFGVIQPGTSKISAPLAAPGVPANRKYPTLAANSRGDALFAWTETMAWKKGGRVAWQVYDKDGHPETVSGKADGVPAWSVIASFAKPDGSFVVVY